MTKKAQSELQMAADRVQEMQEVVDKTEKDLKVCQAAYTKCRLAFEEAQRNLADTEVLLFARQNKLNRETQIVRNIVAQPVFKATNECPF